MTLYINTKDTKVVVVALKEKGKVIKSLTKKNQYGSQVVLPLILKLVQNSKIDFKSLKNIEVEVGPGSFTGLRVGASIAQALSFVLNIPVNGRLNKAVALRYT